MVANAYLFSWSSTAVMGDHRGIVRRIKVERLIASKGGSLGAQKPVIGLQKRQQLRQAASMGDELCIEAPLQIAARHIADNSSRKTDRFNQR